MRDDTNSLHVGVGVRLCLCERRVLPNIFYFIGIRTVNILHENVAHRCMPNRLMILMKLFGQRFIYHLVKSELSTEK